MSEDRAEPLASDPAAGLVHRIAAGDRAAEAELVERYGQQLAFLLRRRTRDQATAEDLYQETFRLALEKLRQGELREPAKLAGFLCGLARNLSLYHYRKGDRRQAWHEPAAADVPDPGPGLLDRLLTDERAALARHVLAEMPTERDREVLSRFYLAEEDKEQICRDLGLAGEHFKRVLFRARQRFKKLYEARAPGGAVPGAGAT